MVGCAVALEQRSNQGTAEHEAALPNLAGRPPGKNRGSGSPFEACHPRDPPGGPKIIPVPGNNRRLPQSASMAPVPPVFGLPRSPAQA